MESNFQKFQKKSLTISIIFLLFSCTAFLFLQAVIDNNIQVAEEAKVLWQEKENTRNELATLDRSLRTIESEQAMLDEHFIKSSDVVPFLNMFEKLAREVGAEAEVTSVNVTEDNLGLLVSIRATGSFQSTYKFLILLENSPYELEFLSMDMKRLDLGTDVEVPQWMVTLEVKLLSFILLK